jgi:hypothetical protein
MSTNNTHSKYKSQLSIQLPSSSIEVFDTPTRYLFQGKLLSATIDKSKAFLSMKVTMPLGVDKWPVDAGELFEEVQVDIHFQTLLIGLMNNDTLEVKLEDNDKILSTFKNRVFRGDFGSPEQHGVDDHDIPLMINVHFRKNHFDLPWEVLEFVVPTMNDEMPFIKAVVKKIKLFKPNGIEINRREVETLMKPFYEDDFVNEKDRLKMEWDSLHGIKNSYEFYSNRLRNWHWFSYQFQPMRENDPLIEKSSGDMLLPLWVDCVDVNREAHGYVEHLSIRGVIKSKKKVKVYESAGELWWLPPEDYGSLLTFLANELINSDSENPFEEVLELYICKWEPNDTIDKCLPHDLERVIEADSYLSKHPERHNFIAQIIQHAKERGLIWV